VLIDDGLVVMVPALHKIFNVVPRDADRAHPWRMDRAQLASPDKLPD
jgi:hypothetical protein